MPMAEPGRPTLYTKELAADICAKLAAGQPLTRICKADAMPSMSSVYLWLNQHSEFSEMYTRAREDQADTMADEIVQIADDGSNDYMISLGEEGKVVYNADNVQRSRLRVDARKWVAAKLKPRKYGDKLELAGDKERPLTIQVLRLTDADSSASG